MPFLPKGAEWIIILIAVLLIFGPKNLPKLGNALGKTVKNLRDGMSDGKRKKDEGGQRDDSPDTVRAEIEGAVEDGVEESADHDSRSVKPASDGDDGASDGGPSDGDDGSSDGDDGSPVSEASEGEASAEETTPSGAGSVEPKKVKRVVRKVPVKETTPSE